MWKSKFYGAFVLNRRVVLHAIYATPARWRGDAGSSLLDGTTTASSSPRNDLVKNCRVHPTHWLISTQVKASADDRLRIGKTFVWARNAPREKREPGRWRVTDVFDSLEISAVSADEIAMNGCDWK